MTDTVTPDVRSRMMAAVKSRDTGPELAVRKSLHAMGFRYRVHKRIGKARPDMVFARYRAAVFIHGCFWHGHGDCRLARMPTSNVGFWCEKIERNMARDIRNMAELAEAHWKTAVVWECAIRDRGAADVANEIGNWLRGGKANIDLAMANRLDKPSPRSSPTAKNPIKAARKRK